ncbi:hypothetical protein [Nocardia sp. NPDC005366]|uniref:hypothetical protein n=1 Tax=Nocardia sp. NPDC005366 TaxID=3156878 RepID=UPI0033B5CEE7
MAPVIVTPNELRQAAESIKNNWLYARADMSTLFARLQICGGCAGTDRIGTKWSSNYDPVAQDAVDAAVSYVIAIGQMHDLVQATAANHANANQLSVIGGAPDDIAFPPGSLEWMKRPEIPNLYGGDSGTPSWWDKIVDYVQGKVWPNAKTDTLADAGTGWSWCAEQLNTHLNFQPARDAIGNQQTPEVQQILDQITLLETQGKALAAQVMTLAHGCVDYSIAVTDAHEKILKELGSFAALWVAGEAVSLAAAEFTFGLSIFAGNGALAARAAVVGSRIAATIRASPRRVLRLRPCSCHCVSRPLHHHSGSR